MAWHRAIKLCKVSKLERWGLKGPKLLWPHYVCSSLWPGWMLVHYHLSAVADLATQSTALKLSYCCYCRTVSYWTSNRQVWAVSCEKAYWLPEEHPCSKALNKPVNSETSTAAWKLASSDSTSVWWASRWVSAPWPTTHNSTSSLGQPSSQLLSGVCLGHLWQS